MAYTHNMYNNNMFMYICSVRGSVCTCEHWIREMCICTANKITSAKIKQKNIYYILRQKPLRVIRHVIAKNIFYYTIVPFLR